MARNYAYRPSQSHMKYVKNRAGEKVINRAYDPSSKAPKKESKDKSKAENILAQEPAEDQETAREARLLNSVRQTLDSDIDKHLRAHRFLTENHEARIRQIAQKGSASAGRLNPGYRFGLSRAYGADGGLSLWKSDNNGRESDIGFGKDYGYGYVNEHGKTHSFNDRPAVYSPDGTVEWHKNGIRHRDNGPAVTNSRFKGYYHNGELRDSSLGHAFEYSNGMKEWRSKGKVERQEFKDGTISTFDRNGHENARWNDNDPSVAQKFNDEHGHKVRIREAAYAEADAHRHKIDKLKEELAKNDGYTEKYVLHSKTGAPVMVVEKTKDGRFKSEYQSFTADDNGNVSGSGSTIKKVKVKTELAPYAENMGYQGEMYRYDVKDTQ